MTIALLRRASLRSWGRHPLQLGLSILGVALGVAVAVSVDLANESAREAFRVSTEAVTGRTTHQIVGGSLGVPEELYVRLRVERGWRAAAPVIDGWVDAPAGRALRVLGIDPLAEAGVRRQFAGAVEGGALDIAALVGSASAVVATVETAASLGLEPGDVLRVLADGVERELVLVGWLEPTAGLDRAGLRDVLVADIATAQDLLGRRGRLDRIDLVADGERHDLDEVRALLPGGVVLVEAAARSASTLEMTRAFALNLQAMSLLALVCGVFLIYNTMTFSVVRRRSLIGQLRVLGVTRREVFGLVLGEALWIGCVGTALGLLVGWFLAAGMVQLVTRTINDLYFTVSVGGVSPDSGSFARAALLGVGATLAAALAPAREATRSQPRAVLQRSDIEDRARRLLPRLSAAGVAGLMAGVLLVRAPSGGLVPAFAGLFLLLVGAALLTPGTVWVLARAATRPLRAVAGLQGALAARGVTAALSRTAVACAALMIAVSVIIGVGVMVSSFRASLVDWLGYTLQADLYVSPAGDSDPGRALEVPRGLRSALERRPEVAGISTIRVVTVPVGAESVQLLALDPGPSTRASYELVAGEGDAWEAFESGAALVSESFAFRRGLGPGDGVVLPSAAGSLELPVAGVYRSYVSDRGAVLLHRRTYDEHWRDEAVSGLSVELSEGAEAASIRATLEAAFAGRQRVVVVSNAELRRQSLVVFDRTFLITGVLRLLVSLVAFVGVFASLMAMALERSRELGTLRATGLTPRQMFTLVTAQTGLLGVIAGLMALPLGVALAWVMIHVLNRRSFGWTLDMQVPAVVLGEAMAIAVFAALLAGVWPALRWAGGLPAAALREE